MSIYLAASENRLGHEHAHLHVHVVLRPAVVLSHRPVVAVGVGLKFTLTPETQTRAQMFTHKKTSGGLLMRLL